MLFSSALVDSEPPPPPFKALATSSNSAAAAAADVAAAPPSAFSYSPSLLIIAAILAFVVIASATIHLLLRLLSHRASHSSPPLIHPRSSSASASAASTSSQAPEREQEKEREAQIAALPVFTLASAAPKSSGDCAVCLSRFRPHDELRLLPSCRHAFHAACVDAWLRSTPSCPLCRASIVVPAPPPPPPAAAAQREAEESERSESFRVEIGSVSRRRSSAGVTPADAPPHGRSFSLGSAFDYLVEEEVEAVVARALRRPSMKEQKPEANDGGAGAPAPPGVEVAEAVGERGGSWLRDYVDRLASSASSSFSSLRFSSRRFDAAAVSSGDSWDFEANQIRTATAAEEGGYSALYRWLIGLSS